MYFRGPIDRNRMARDRGGRYATPNGNASHLRNMLLRPQPWVGDERGRSRRSRPCTFGCNNAPHPVRYARPVHRRHSFAMRLRAASTKPAYWRALV